MPDNKNISMHEDMYMHEDMEMENPGMMHDNMHHMNHESLLDTLQDCEETCEHMTTHLLRHKDSQRRSMQLELLRDCADICTFTSKYIARHSTFSKYAANVCAFVCEVCGNECLKFRDAESQRCGRICLDCARACRAFAMM